MVVEWRILYTIIFRFFCFVFGFFSFVILSIFLLVNSGVCNFLFPIHHLTISDLSNYAQHYNQLILGFDFICSFMYLSFLWSVYLIFPNVEASLLRKTPCMLLSLLNYKLNHIKWSKIWCFPCLFIIDD